MKTGLAVAAYGQTVHGESNIQFFCNVSLQMHQKWNDTVMWKWLKTCVPPAVRFWYRRKNASVYLFLLQTFDVATDLSGACACVTDAGNLTHMSLMTIDIQWDAVYLQRGPWITAANLLLCYSVVNMPELARMVIASIAHAVGSPFTPPHSAYCHKYAKAVKWERRCLLMLPASLCLNRARLPLLATGQGFPNFARGAVLHMVAGP
jgi:hypothetical protein